MIAGYLPEQLSEDEITALVSETIDELGVRDDGLRAMGRVMGALQPRTKGRADGGDRGCDRARAAGWRFLSPVGLRAGSAGVSDPMRDTR